MIPEIVSYRACIQNLVVKDLKLKYRGSVLGFLWSLLNPLLMLAVYTLAFKYVLRVQMENYTYFLLVGLLPWNFFSNSLLSSTQAIIGNANLIKKVYFPREILPIATVLFAFAQFVLALVVVLPGLALLFRVTPHWAALLFLPLLVLHLLFTIGLAFVLSALTTTFRDVAHFAEVGLAMLFWVTPIIYSADMAPPRLQLFFRGSPVSAFAIAYQDVLFRGRVPDLTVMVTVVSWTVVTLLGGHAIFRSRSPAFAEAV